MLRKSFLSVSLVNATKENHIFTPKNHNYRNSVLDHVFSYIGIEYADSVYVKQRLWQRLLMFKALIVIVYLLELPSLFCQKLFISFVCKFLETFYNQYGAPKQVLSEKQYYIHKEIGKKIHYLHGIKWSFNITEAPWTGGHCERMVHSVKQCLKKILGQARVRFDELLKTLKEIENVCDSRPLTYIYDDDIIKPLSQII